MYRQAYGHTGTSNHFLACATTSRDNDSRARETEDRTEAEMLEPGRKRKRERKRKRKKGRKGKRGREHNAGEAISGLANSHLSLLASRFSLHTLSEETSAMPDALVAAVRPQMAQSDRVLPWLMGEPNGTGTTQDLQMKVLRLLAAVRCCIHRACIVRAGVCWRRLAKDAGRLADRDMHCRLTLAMARHNQV